MVLSLKQMGVDKPEQLDWLDPPDATALQQAMRQVRGLWVEGSGGGGLARIQEGGGGLGQGGGAWGGGHAPDARGLGGWRRCNRRCDRCVGNG
jgi:hypothetical protein